MDDNKCTNGPWAPELSMSPTARDAGSSKALQWTAGVRNYRTSAEGLANGSNRPLADFASGAEIKQTVRKLDATLSTAAQKAKFRDFFCSARPQPAKFEPPLMRLRVFARSA